MPLQSETPTPKDGRQSETALLVARGTRRLLRNRKFSTLTELPLASGRRAEILREAPEHRLAAATRRNVLLRFAHAAAHRLHGLSDPEIMSFGPL